MANESVGGYLGHTVVSNYLSIPRGLTTCTLYPNAGCSVVPRSTVVLEGSSATFNCSCSDAIAVGWLFNHSSLNIKEPPEKVYRNPTVNSVASLTVSGLRSYNGVAVACIATFEEPLEEFVSPPAFLTVLGMVTDCSCWSCDST